MSLFGKKTVKSVNIPSLFYRSFDGANQKCGHYVDLGKNHFVMVDSPLSVPKSSVKGFSEDQVEEVLLQLFEIFPEYFREHVYHSNPLFLSHRIECAQIVKGGSFDFAHLLSFDLKYPGKGCEVVEKGDTDNYPSYKTGRIFFTSRIFPVQSFESRENYICNIESRRLFPEYAHESDQFFFANTLFDDMDKSGNTGKILSLIDSSIFPFSLNVFPLVEYADFTLAVNVINPAKDVVSDFVSSIEPLLVHVFESIEKKEMRVFFDERLKKLFSRYSLYSDDSLALERIRRIDIAN